MNLFKKIIRALIGPLSMLMAALILMSDFGAESAGGGLKRFLVAGVVIILGFLLNLSDFLNLKKTFMHPVDGIVDMLKKFEK